MFSYPPVVDAQPQSRWLAALSGLVGAGIVALAVCSLSRPYIRSLDTLAESAAARLLQVFVTCAVIVWVLCVIRWRMDRTSIHRLAERTSFDALWLAPLVLFFCQNSIWVVLVTVIFLACVAKSFRSLCENSTAMVEAIPAHEATAMFESLDPPFGSKQLVPTVSMAFCAEIGIAATFLFSPPVGALLVGTSFAMWFSTAEVHRHTWPDSRFRQSLTLTLTMILTAAGLLRYVSSGGIGGFGFPAPASGWSEQRRASHTNNSASHDLSAYPGIVLWPEKRTVTKLVAPPPVLDSAIFPGQRRDNPLSIPFNGVYWLFRAPDLRPPQGTRESHGSPESLSMRSTDPSPISMEAHQNLGSLMSLDCCKKIEVTIRNKDRYPGTVSLELILTNTTLRGKPSRSLGMKVVKSSLNWIANDKRAPVDELLSFDIPANTAMHRFDEVTVAFHLAANRARFAPKIGIDRFVLVPR
ncbi:MAG TPA: hypothetical protein VLK33_19960 [Terriglobales bacterium]|nr:hypothetical protein [Terriglobales bacterium]